MIFYRNFYLDGRKIFYIFFVGIMLIKLFLSGKIIMWNNLFILMGVVFFIKSNIISKIIIIVFGLCEY